MFIRALALVAAIAASLCFSLIPASAGFVHDHTWSFSGVDGSGDTLDMSGTLQNDAGGNGFGGLELIAAVNPTAFTGTVSFNGGPASTITSVANRPSGPGPNTVDGIQYDDYIYENPQSAGFSLDGYGILFSYNKQIGDLFLSYMIHVWGSQDPNGTPGGAQSTDPTLTSAFVGNFVLDPVATATTPLPAALPLFASGLGALGVLGWRRKRKTA